MLNQILQLHIMKINWQNEGSDNGGKKNEKKKNK